MRYGFVPCERGSVLLNDLSSNHVPVNPPQGWRPQILQVAQLGHPVLRKKCLAIPPDKVGAWTVQLIINDMLETLKDFDGVGISAPQVFWENRVFIVASNPNPRYPDAPKMEPTAMINPVIVNKSEEIVTDWEGCLSIPGIRGLVPRFKSVEVEYYNREGKKVTDVLHDFVARIFQHELDHLDGIVFLDRAKAQDLITDKMYQQMKRKELK